MHFENDRTDPEDRPPIHETADDYSGAPAGGGDYDALTADGGSDGLEDIDDGLPEVAQSLEDAGLSEQELAIMQFNFRVITPPTPDEVTKLQEREDSVDWLGFVTTRSPIEKTFGGESGFDRAERNAAGISYRDGDRLPPEFASDIVDRQLGTMSSTMAEVTDGIKATGDLAELTGEHAGRSLAWERDMAEKSFISGLPPHVVFADRHAIYTEPQTPPRVEEISPPRTDYADDVVRVDTDDGEVHLVAKDGTSRIRVRTDPANGEVAIDHEEKYTVDPGDAQYFKTLNEDLTRHRDLLLDVAQHAGFNRDDIIDEHGEVNVGFLLTQVDPAIGDADFQANLPEGLRTALQVSARVIAERVNPTYQQEDNLSQKGFRLGGYFRAALGRRDS